MNDGHRQWTHLKMPHSSAFVDLILLKIVLMDVFIWRIIVGIHNEISHIFIYNKNVMWASTSSKFCNKMPTFNDDNFNFFKHPVILFWYFPWTPKSYLHSIKIITTQNEWMIIIVIVRTSLVIHLHLELSSWIAFISRLLLRQFYSLSSLELVKKVHCWGVIFYSSHLIVWLFHDSLCRFSHAIHLELLSIFFLLLLAFSLCFTLVIVLHSIITFIICVVCELIVSWKGAIKWKWKVNIYECERCRALKIN